MSKALPRVFVLFLVTALLFSSPALALEERTLRRQSEPGLLVSLWQLLGSLLSDDLSKGRSTIDPNGVSDPGTVFGGGGEEADTIVVFVTIVE